MRKLMIVLAVLAMVCDSDSPTVPTSTATPAPTPQPTPTPAPVATECVPLPAGDHPVACEGDPGGNGPYGLMLLELRDRALEEFPGLFTGSGWNVKSKRDYVAAIRVLIERDVPGLCTTTNRAGDEVAIKPAGPEGDPNDPRTRAEWYDLVAESSGIPEAWVWWAASCQPANF